MVGNSIKDWDIAYHAYYEIQRLKKEKQPSLKKLLLNHLKHAEITKAEGITICSQTIEGITIIGEFKGSNPNSLSVRFEGTEVYLENNRGIKEYFPGAWYRILNAGEIL
ncbi:hypothetical protein CL616_04115 [archaeon]|nr:hypothetical protein [archaeon]